MTRRRNPKAIRHEPVPLLGYDVLLAIRHERELMQEQRQQCSEPCSPAEEPAKPAHEEK
jgi:hypothetical protein